MCQLRDGHGPGHKVKELVDHPSSQRRMRDGVMVDVVPVHQPASGLVNQLGVYRHTRYVRQKGHQPESAGNSPRWGNFFPECAMPQTAIHHVSLSSEPGNHSVSPSREYTILQGTATAAPTPDDCPSYVDPIQA